MPFSVKSHGLLYGFTNSCKCMSMWGLPMFDFVRKAVSLGKLAHFREFSALPNDGFARKIVSFELLGHHREFSALPEIGFYRKMVPLRCGGQHKQYKGFCSSNFEAGSETDEDSDYDVDGGEESEGGEIHHGSAADMEEVIKVVMLIDKLLASRGNMEAALDKCGINLTHNLVVQVLLRFQHARKPAFGFFCWASQRPGFQHDSRTYNVMLQIMGKLGQFETLWSLLEEMRKNRVLNMESFRIAVKSFAAGKERTKAVAVFQLMKRCGFEEDVETINWLLDALVQGKLMNQAQAMYDKLKHKFSLTEKTYSILINGWCKLKNIVEAGRMWNEMIDQGIKPGVLAYNIMIDGLLEVQNRSDAIKLFEIMKAKGPSPNVRTYTIIIRYLCEDPKMMKVAIGYFDEMLASRLEPDIALFTCLVIGYGKLKEVDVVHGLFKNMKGRGMPPDRRLYNGLIKLMTSRQMPDEALRIYEKMINNGIEPTILTYNMLMKSYFLLGNSEKGRAIWDEMFRRGCCPDENSYAVLIGELLRQGRADEACKYVEEIINKGMRVPELDFNNLNAYNKRIGQPDILEELARKMKLSGKSEVSEVFAWWSEMKRRGSMRRY